MDTRGRAIDVAPFDFWLPFARPFGSISIWVHFVAPGSAVCLTLDFIYELNFLVFNFGGDTVLRGCDLFSGSAACLTLDHIGSTLSSIGPEVDLL